MQMNITGIGRLGNNPEVRTLNNGGKVANFDLAQSIPYKDGNEWKERTVWYKVAFFDLADRVEKLLGKGDLVSVSGSFEASTFTRRDGSEGTELKITGLAFDRILKAKED